MKILSILLALIVAITVVGSVAAAPSASSFCANHPSVRKCVRPTPRPTPTPTASPRPTPTPTVAPTATPTIAPTPTPTIAPTPTPSSTASPTPTVSPTPTPTPSPTATPTPTPSPTATPAGLSMYAPIYGTGLEMDSKDNFQVGWTLKARVDYRFRSSGGAVKSIAVNLRGGSGYSGGNGGQLHVAIQADASGAPSGVDLASVTWAPGNPAGGWEDKSAHAFTTQPTLASGVLYHIVFSNPSATQTTDYVSVNTTTVLSGGLTGPLQPAFTDDFAFFYNTGSGWTRNVSSHSPNITPVMDLAYTDGRHDGNAYFQATVDYYALVSGSNQVRETMTPKTSVSVSSAYVRLKRISGTSPITFTLERSGTILASGIVSGSQIPATTYPTPASGDHWDEASLAGGRWVGLTFPSVTMAAGTTYDLRLQTASDTTYLAMPIREVSNEISPTWASRAFRDGEAQKTSGSTWAPFYEFAPHDMQFYLR